MIYRLHYLVIILCNLFIVSSFLPSFVAVANRLQSLFDTLQTLVVRRSKEMLPVVEHKREGQYALALQVRQEGFVYRVRPLDVGWLHIVNLLLHFQVLRFAHEWHKHKSHHIVSLVLVIKAIVTEHHPLATI